MKKIFFALITTFSILSYATFAQADDTHVTPMCPDPSKIAVFGPFRAVVAFSFDGIPLGILGIWLGGFDDDIRTITPGIHLDDIYVTKYPSLGDLLTCKYKMPYGSSTVTGILNLVSDIKFTDCKVNDQKNGFDCIVSGNRSVNNKQ